MGVKSTGQVTAEGTNAAGDEIEAASAREADADNTIAELVSRARAAMEVFKDYDQERVDEVVRAVAWAIIKRENAEELARLAVEYTGLGKYEDKVNKNRRKSLGTLRDLVDSSARSVGVIEVDEEKGITKIAKPVGVVAAVTPSTNPAATPANKTMMALKGRNAIIIAPSPKGASTCTLLLRYIHEELSKVGAPLDLVQALPRVDKELAHELMQQADFVTVTGSANNVRAGQTSGTPNACVGAGNVVSVVDATADIEEAACKIRTSKTFDYGTSCSNDNSVVIEAPVYEEMVEALKREGGYLCNDEERALLGEALWPDGGKRSGETLCKAPSVIAEVVGLENPEAREASFFMVEGKGVGEEDPFSGEKLGYLRKIEEAGGMVLEGVCFYILDSIARLRAENGWDNLVTNSAKLANIIAAHKFNPILRRTEECVEVAPLPEGSSVRERGDHRGRAGGRGDRRGGCPLFDGGVQLEVRPGPLDR